jgi:hypothetical protein
MAHYPAGSNWKSGPYCNSTTYKYIKYNVSKNILKPEIATDTIVVLYNPAKKDAVVVNLDICVSAESKLSFDNIASVVGVFKDKIRDNPIKKEKLITNISVIGGKRIKKTAKKYGGGYYMSAVQVKVEIAFFESNS